MKILYFLLILPLSAHAAGPTSTAPDINTDYHDGRFVLDSSEGAERMKLADPIQKPYTDALNKAGSRCIEGWSAYFGDYTQIQRRLKVIADEAHAVVSRAETQAGAPVSESDLAQVDACSGAGETMVTMLNQRADEMRKARDAIGVDIDDFDKALRIAQQEFQKGALAKFKRSLDCPLQTTYLNPAKAAIKVSGDHPDAKYKSTSFDVTKSVLYGYSNYLREKERSLGIYADRMASFRKSCGGK